MNSAFLSLLNSSQINVALGLHRSITITAHPFPSPIAPGSLTVASACHLVVDRTSRAPSNQINPTSIIPYLRSCLATIPSTQNRVTGEEPPWNFTGGRYPPPPSDAWARAHGVVPRWQARARLG
jgi:hypothetical protein